MYLTQGLHRAMQQRPDALATCCGKRKLTFRQFGGRVARLAAGLGSLGMQAGDRVAMLALNSDRYLEYQMAVPWGGGVLNPCNIRWSAAEIIFSLNDSGSKILIVDDAFLPMVEQIRREAKTVCELIYAGDGTAPSGMHDYEALLAKSAPMKDVARRGNDLAGIFYTGGTTGFPKGVMLSHANLCSSGLAIQAEGMAQSGSVYLHAAPMFHLADFGISVAHWLAGNTHAVVPVFRPEVVLEAIAEHGVTHTLLVPTMIQLLVEQLEASPGHGLDSLRTIIFGASPITEALLERAIEVLPGVGFVQAYGMTELSPLATINASYGHGGEGYHPGRLHSAGRACHCTEVRIVDPAGNEVPRGAIGEVVVRGPNVMQGYWGKPEQTAAVLCQGWMHTGDGGYMDADGYLFIVDRMKDMIISGGENVYSAEVENAVTHHPAVAACAVIGVPDERWGERVHAVVVLKPGDQVNAEELVAHCRSLIAGYKCPRSVEFRAALPLSGAGKVLKTELRKAFWSQQARNVS